MTTFFGGPTKPVKVKKKAATPVPAAPAAPGKEKKKKNKSSIQPSDVPAAGFPPPPQVIHQQQRPSGPENIPASPPIQQVNIYSPQLAFQSAPHGPYFLVPAHQYHGPYVEPQYFAQPQPQWGPTVGQGNYGGQMQPHPWASTANLQQARPDLIRQPYSAPVVPLSQQNLALHHQDAKLQNREHTGVHEMEDDMSVLITALDNDEDLEKDSPNQIANSRNVPAPASRPCQPRGLIPASYISKAWSYSNSRLPPHLPPFQVLISTYSLLCLAARYSLSAYSASELKAAPAPLTKNTTTTIRIPSSLRSGTKAMVLALAPCTCSTTPTLVLAIRGSATFSDWAINFRPSPETPTGLLDDAGNLVHSGFLAVAKSMLVPVAQQIQRFLAQQTDAGMWRDQGQLLLTGHSAGGAVASLLYCHLLSQNRDVRSALKDMRCGFKRVHCITFGVPPLSLLPLERPTLSSHDGPNVNTTARNDAQKRWKKNLFFTFLNEGDPVVRADRAFIRSLLDLYRKPVPLTGTAGTQPTWAVPPNTLSNAGRLVVLRPVRRAKVKKKGFLGFETTDDTQKKDGEQRLEAVIATDEQLRGVVYGDPMMHSMRLYRERIDELAVRAMTCD